MAAQSSFGSLLVESLSSLRPLDFCQELSSKRECSPVSNQICRELAERKCLRLLFMTLQSSCFTQQKFPSQANTKKNELYFSWAITSQYAEHPFSTVHMWLQFKWNLLDPCCQSAEGSFARLR